MFDEKREFLKYVHTVLGVQQVLFAAHDLPSAEGALVTSRPQPRILFTGELPENPQENELFEKMLAAIGVSREEALISAALTEEFALQEYPGLPFVAFGADEGQHSVPSPRQLLQAPEKKRMAWEALKKVKARLAKNS